uniref:Uncharacterized protein n=1 Tax=Caenorhabditis japonica TaxID=281687 RepID=A0A8R1HME4_CAEJA
MQGKTQNNINPRMGRPLKAPPFSHYEAYKGVDVYFFISLFAGREELYSPCEDFCEFRQKAMIFIEKNFPNMPSPMFNTSVQKDLKRPKMEESVDDKSNDHWLQKVIQTVKNESTSAEPMLPETSERTVTPCEPDQSKHSDIISCVTNFLDEVPNNKLMLYKVRLFQFIEGEKNRLQIEGNGK